MGRSNKNVVEGPALKKVQSIIKCLDQGIDDEALAIKIRGVGMPLETWSRLITDASHLARVRDVSQRYAGRKIEVTVQTESAVA